jgi:DnaJ domain
MCWKHIRCSALYLVRYDTGKKPVPSNCCYYFTNAQRVRDEDPYATLGLLWGATQSEIKAAFRERASQLHPDVNKTDSPSVARKKFQLLSSAYEKLTKAKGQQHPNLDDDEWQWSIWLRSTRIAESRTDVAGVAKLRPIPPAIGTKGSQLHPYMLGHPSGLGSTTNRRGGEFLGTKATNGPTSSVGRGINKWVDPKPYQPWNNPKD